MKIGFGKARRASAELRFGIVLEKCLFYQVQHYWILYISTAGKIQLSSGFGKTGLHRVLVWNDASNIAILSGATLLKTVYFYCRVFWNCLLIPHRKIHNYFTKILCHSFEVCVIFQMLPHTKGSRHHGDLWSRSPRVVRLNMKMALLVWLVFR